MFKKLFLISAVLSFGYTKLVFRDSHSDPLQLVEATTNILRSCYSNQVSVIGLVGNLTGRLRRSLTQSPAIALIDPSRRVVPQGTLSPMSLHKLQLFVVSVSSTLALREILVELKNSKWWNHLANFLFVLWSPEKTCFNAYIMLWSIWKMDILNAKLVCYHTIRGLMIYTFNPYTSKAPASWRLSQVFRGIKGHPWTLYARAYKSKNVSDNCFELDFDKTLDLGGYEFRVSVTDASFNDIGVRSSGICAGLYEDMYCEVMFPMLNVTPKVIVHKSINAIGYVDDMGTPHGILADVLKGVSDIGFPSRYLTSMSNISMTYPHWSSELRSLTHYPGYKSQWSKIMSVIDGSSRLGLCAVVVTSVLFFKYLVRQALVEANLNTLRIVCNTSLPRVPKRASARIYLGSLFLFIVTMQGIYQGQLASLLSKQEPLRYVNNMRDLAELDYRIYASKSYRLFFQEPEFEGRFIGVNTIECHEFVEHDPNAACVSDSSVTIYEAAKFNLHMSREDLASPLAAFPIRPDWPLEDRVNKLLMRFGETYQIRYLYDRALHGVNRLIEHQENEKTDQTVKVLSLDQLRFAFVVWWVGLACGAISFGVEVSLSKIQGRVGNFFSCFKVSSGDY